MQEKKAPKFKRTFETIRNKYMLNFLYNYSILYQKDKMSELPEDQAIALRKAFDSEVMDSNQDGIVTL